MQHSDPKQFGKSSDSLPCHHGPWQINQSKIAYQDPWLTVRRDEVTRPDGKPGSYAMVMLKPGVCVVAIDDDQNVHLTEEFHYAVGRVTLEGVSGGIEDGHDAEETAHKELQEELGIQAGIMQSLGVTDPFTGSVLSPTALFVARDLTFGDSSPESTEQITHITMSLHEAVQHVLDGRITHAPTCLILLRLAFSSHQ